MFIRHLRNASFNPEKSRAEIFTLDFDSLTNVPDNIMIDTFFTQQFIIAFNVDRMSGVDKSSPPSATYMRQRIGSALVQIMACRLFYAKPLSKPMLGYCQLDP